MKNLNFLNHVPFGYNSVSYQNDYFIELIVSKVSMNVIEFIKEYLPPQDEYLTIKETCEMVKKSRSIIYEWRDKGLLLPIAKSGKSPLYSKRQVEEFLLKQAS